VVEEEGNCRRKIDGDGRMEIDGDNMRVQ